MVMDMSIPRLATIITAAALLVPATASAGTAHSVHQVSRHGGLTCRYYVTCEQRRVSNSLWTCFVIADHVRKCSRAEARSVLVGKYRVRIYRNRKGS